MGILSWMTRMPGKSFAGTLPSAGDAEQKLAHELERDLRHLAGAIGERNVSRRPAQLELAALWIEHELQSAGWEIERQEYEVQGERVRNIVAELAGTSSPKEIVVIGAHYDSVIDCPGANDNGTGVVSLLALARRLNTGRTHRRDDGTTAVQRDGAARTLRLAFFVNEEPPWFQQNEMGSLVYARRCHQRKENVIAMLSLETMGYYTDAKNSQEYPTPILRAMFPTVGNFIGFVGSSRSAPLVRRCVNLFRSFTKFPSEGAAIPGVIPGVAWSDHWSFQIHGYPALMVTDTAPFRYPYYHTPEDTPDKVDYDKLARVTLGLEQVVMGLINN